MRKIVKTYKFQASTSKLNEKSSSMANFSPSFKFKICQAKITKYIAVNYFWLVDFKILTDFE